MERKVKVRYNWVLMPINQNHLHFKGKYHRLHCCIVSNLRLVMWPIRWRSCRGIAVEFGWSCLPNYLIMPRGYVKLFHIRICCIRNSFKNIPMKMDEFARPWISKKCMHLFIFLNDLQSYIWTYSKDHNVDLTPAQKTRNASAIVRKIKITIFP